MVPQKASSQGGGGRGGGWGVGGVVNHTLTGQYIGVATYFVEPGVKLDEKSIENGLEVQKFLVVCLFWGGCHHPNKAVDECARVSGDVSSLLRATL